MLDSFDYKEPSCALCGGKEFYNPDKDAPVDTVPVRRIIEKADGYYAKNDLNSAITLLEYWQNEANALNDKRGELSVTSELIGAYRKSGQKDKGLAAVKRALELTDVLGIRKDVSAATVILNAATTLKAFGKAEEALPLYDEVFAVYSSNLSPEDKMFAGYYNNAALSLADTGRYDKAEECFYKAINILSKHDDGQVDAAISYVNLAHLYESSKENAQKEITDCLFKAYALLGDEKVKHDSYYAFVLTKCAPSFGHFGYALIEKQMIKEAEDIYERA